MHAPQKKERLQSAVTEVVAFVRQKGKAYKPSLHVDHVAHECTKLETAQKSLCIPYAYPEGCFLLTDYFKPFLTFVIGHHTLIGAQLEKHFGGWRSYTKTNYRHLISYWHNCTKR